MDEMRDEFEDELEEDEHTPLADEPLEDEEAPLGTEGELDDEEEDEDALLRDFGMSRTDEFGNPEDDGSF